MYFLFNLLRIKGPYMFRALLVHPQEVLHKRHMMYCVCVMSVSCNRFKGYTLTLVQPTDIKHTQYTKWRLWSTLILNTLNKSASRWFQCTDILWCTVNRISNRIFKIGRKFGLNCCDWIVRIQETNKGHVLVRAVTDLQFCNPWGLFFE
jgi:hypothetical protein